MQPCAAAPSAAAADAAAEFARRLHLCVNAGVQAPAQPASGAAAGSPDFALEAPCAAPSPPASPSGACAASAWVNSEPLQRVRLLASGEVFAVPLHWGVVEAGVYRSGFPVAETFPFLARLGVRTVVNLQDRLPLDYKNFLAEQRVQYIHAPVKGNKVHPEEMDWGRVSAALALVSDTAFHPILVHCACGLRAAARPAPAVPASARLNCPPPAAPDPRSPTHPPPQAAAASTARAP
jgi:hypothetical protein